jgi:hypothetical protein
MSGVGDGIALGSYNGNKLPAQGRTSCGQVKDFIKNKK